MTSAPFRIFGIAIGLVLLTGGTTVRASDPCIGDAQETFADCKGNCKEAYQVAKDDCSNKDHACMEQCREVRVDCIDSTSLPGDLAVCRHQLEHDKQDCRDAHPNDPTGLNQCIDQAQVVAFLCRKAARQKAKPAIAQCRSGFRSCARDCGPPNPPSDVVDPVQCKLDATKAYVACKANCREAFQQQKDLCLGHDHQCVEGCRATRDQCTQPLEDQLDAEIAKCNATRGSEIGNCKTLYPDPDDPRLATCITNAEVDAFQCRDQARENARPGLQQCRDDFTSCAKACPPPPPS